MRKEENILRRNVRFYVVQKLGLKWPRRQKCHTTTVDDLFTLTTDIFTPFDIETHGGVSTGQSDFVLLMTAVFFRAT
jgi:hypothetical protein